MRSFLFLCVCLTACSPAPMMMVSATTTSARVGDSVTLTVTTSGSGAITLSASNGGTVTPASVMPVNGSATAQLTSAMAGEVTVTATQGSTMASTSVTFTSGPRLRFQTSPGTTASQNLLRPIPQVAIEENGSVVTSSTASVTVAVTPGSCNAQLDSTSLSTVNAQQGVASFNGLKITTPVNGCTLTATSGSLPSAVSSSFNITP